MPSGKVAEGSRAQAVQEGRRPDWPCAARPLICIVPIFVVTAVFFANAIAASDLGFFDFRIVAMAKIRPPLITEAIHISDPSPCIQVLRPGLGYSNPVTTSRDADPDRQNASRAQILVIKRLRRPIAVVTGGELQ